MGIRDQSSREEEKHPAQSKQAQGMWLLKKPELALGLLAGRKVAWQKPIVTGGSVLAVGREAKLRKGKILYPESAWLPPSSGDPVSSAKRLVQKGYKCITQE